MSGSTGGELGGSRALARSVLWVVIIATGALGFIGGMGRGPGLLFGTVLVALYDLLRHRHIPARGYLLLTVGLGAAMLLWLVVPLL